MTDTSSDYVSSSKRQLFTTRYTYGSQDQEYVFSCRGRPFVALVSPNYPTPTSSLFDYDLIKSLGLKLTDLQCRKFFFAGNKFRILGRISTTVQCVQNGRSCSNFHLKGLVISDLNKVLDTHCIAGAKMQQQLVSAEDDPSDDDLDDHLADDQDVVEEYINERKCDTNRQVNTRPAKRKSVAKAQNVTKKPSVRRTGPRADDVPAAIVVGQGGGVCQRHHVLQDQDGLSNAAAGTDNRSSPAGATDDSANFWVRVISDAPKVMPPSSPNTRKFGVRYSPEVRTNMPPGTCPRPSSLYSLIHSNSGDYDFWSQYSKSSEGNILRMSRADGKPRVVNVEVEEGKDDMLRVGFWTDLDDHSKHQARHVLLASLRRAAPDRVCRVCSYNLQHNCQLSTYTKHCDMCCDDVKSKSIVSLKKRGN